MTSIRFDESRDPLIVIAFTGTASDEDFDAYLARMDLIVERRRPNVMIFDARKAERPGPAQRHLQSAWMKKHDDLLRRHSLGCAFVLSSAVVRGALTAIFWVQPAAMPTLVTGNMAEATAWCLAKLGEKGVAAPA